MLLLGVGMLLGFRVGTDVWRLLGAFALLLVFALAFSWVSVLVGVRRQGPGEGADLRLHRAVPADLRQQRVRADRDDARLAAAVGRRSTR